VSAPSDTEGLFNLLRLGAFTLVFVHDLIACAAGAALFGTAKRPAQQAFSNLIHWSRPMSTLASSSHRTFRPMLITTFIAALALFLPAAAQVNDVGQRPYLGWSSFSEQTINGSF
jgi:hypothetical protein